MIPMPVTPDNAIDPANVEATIFEDLAQVLFDVQAGNSILYRCRCNGGEIPPIFPAPKIKEDGLSQLLVFYKEGKGGHVHGLMALLNWLHKSLGRYHNVCRSINDVDLDAIRLGGVEI